jgi:hypothetical protein
MCAKDSYGPNCTLTRDTSCTWNTTCNGTGRCKSDGTCECFPNFNCAYVVKGTDTVMGKFYRMYVDSSVFMYVQNGSNTQLNNVSTGDVNYSSVAADILTSRAFAANTCPQSSVQACIRGCNSVQLDRCHRNFGSCIRQYDGSVVGTSSPQRAKKGACECVGRLRVCMGDSGCLSLGKTSLDALCRAVNCTWAQCQVCGFCDFCACMCVYVHTHTRSTTPTTACATGTHTRAAQQL